MTHATTTPYSSDTTAAGRLARRLGLTPRPETFGEQFRNSAAVWLALMLYWAIADLLVAAFPSTGRPWPGLGTPLHIGFAIAVTTGIALLSAQATVVAGAGAAPWKFGLLILAGLNIPVFHYGVYRRVDEWTDAAVTPVAARVGAAMSLVAWMGVIIAGRLLAYT